MALRAHTDSDKSRQGHNSRNTFSLVFLFPRGVFLILDVRDLNGRYATKIENEFQMNMI